jgi:prophage regulatory protein
MEALATHRVLRLNAVKAKTGKSTSGIYADMASGKFPKPIPVGERAVGWLESEIDTWIETCLRKRDAASTRAWQRRRLIGPPLRNVNYKVQCSARK